jgi:CDK-activating kinase assembly factor MAT1
MSKSSSRPGAQKDGMLTSSPLSKSLYSMSLQPRTSPPKSRRADSTPDICPVCKSSRYLNPNMKFLVNPECYHKMCESCVDRIFSHGPAPCPIAGCKRTLRKAKFRTQTFEDLKVEREVDIRRRVNRV